MYHDSDLFPAEVEGDGSAELGGGAGEEHVLGVAGDLVQDHGGRQGVAVHHPHPQLRVLVHEQGAASVQRLILPPKLTKPQQIKSDPFCFPHRSHTSEKKKSVVGMSRSDNCSV